MIFEKLFSLRDRVEPFSKSCRFSCCVSGSSNAMNKHGASFPFPSLQVGIAGKEVLRTLKSPESRPACFLSSKHTAVFVCKSCCTVSHQAGNSPGNRPNVSRKVLPVEGSLQVGGPGPSGALKLAQREERRRTVGDSVQSAPRSLSMFMSPTKHVSWSSRGSSTLPVAMATDSLGVCQ